MRGDNGDEQAQHGWGNESEMRFISLLGEHANHSRNTPPPSRRTLLENYIAYLGQRKRWGKLNSSVVMEFAEQQLQAEIEKGRGIG